MNYTGEWFDPTRDGCGLVLVERNGVIAGQFFAHSFDGFPIWFSVTEKEGGEFKSEFDVWRTEAKLYPTSKPVKHRVVGTVRIYPVVDDEEISVEVSINHNELYMLDFSPPPPSTPHTDRFDMRRVY